MHAAALPSGRFHCFFKILGVVMLFSTLRSWLRSPSGPRNARRTTARLQFERFEDRVTPTVGALDAGFGIGGKQTTDFTRTIDQGEFEPPLVIHGTDSAQTVVTQADGRIVVAGTTDVDGSMDFAVVRYNPDGTLDTSFGVGGLVHTDFGFMDQENATGVVLQGNKILVGGFARINGTDEFALARYNSDGSLDTSFGSSGLVHVAPVGNLGSAAKAIALTPT